ncbi:hypothetical protein OHQ90_27625 [Nocardia sp. NBC_00403]
MTNDIGPLNQLRTDQFAAVACTMLEVFESIDFHDELAPGHENVGPGREGGKVFLAGVEEAEAGPQVQNCVVWTCGWRSHICQDEGAVRISTAGVVELFRRVIYTDDVIAAPTERPGVTAEAARDIEYSRSEGQSEQCDNRLDLALGVIVSA